MQGSRTHSGKGVDMARMNEVFEMSLNGSCYTWNDGQWCDRNFVRPPETIILELNKVLEPQLLGESLLGLGAWELTEEAMVARDSKLYKYAMKCLGRALEIDPDNKYAVNVLASMNRKDFGKSGKAIKTTDAASPSKTRCRGHEGGGIS